MIDLKFIILLPILGFIVILFFFFKQRKKFEIYYQSLGGKDISTWTFPYTKAYLEKDGIVLKLGTSGYRANFYLYLSIPLRIRGFLLIRKASFLEKFWAEPLFLKEKLLAEYDDENWFKNIINKTEIKESFLQTFNKYQLKGILIKDGELRFEWNIKQGPWEISKETILSSITELSILSNWLDRIPSSSIGYNIEKLRNLLGVKLPIGITLFLFGIGIVGGFYNYQPLCLLEALWIGLKITLPVVLTYIGLISFFIGRKNLFWRLFWKSFMVMGIGSFFISLFFLTLVNGIFDTSLPQKHIDFIEKKYRSIKHGYRIQLKNYHQNKFWCDFSVSKEFYNQVSQGQKVEFWSKKGFLGIEWLYLGLKIVKE
ncbi:MAG: hypothetical protein N3A56_07335 [Thermodesulfobacteriaceae bacterium]|nr:hypothetical protein [Thermodesulfobacteriaceae bacterium]